MVGHYKKRDGLGKCEANRFLMNLASRAGDSWRPGGCEIDKAFVIQNLFQWVSDLVFPPEIFLNYSLDTTLSPARRSALVEPVDNHLQDTEKYG